MNTFIYVYSSIIAMQSDILLKLYICTKLLEVEGVYGLLNIESLSFNLLPIDKDIITMELDFFYTSYFLVSQLRFQSVHFNVIDW